MKDLEIKEVNQNSKLDGIAKTIKSYMEVVAAYLLHLQLQPADPSATREATPGQAARGPSCCVVSTFVVGLSQ